MKAADIEERIKHEFPVSFVTGQTLMDACKIACCEVMNTAEGMPIYANRFYCVTKNEIYEVE